MNDMPTTVPGTSTASATGEGKDNLAANVSSPLRIFTPQAVALLLAVIMVMQFIGFHLYHTTLGRPLTLAVVDLSAIVREKEASFARIVSADSANPKAREAAIAETQRFAAEMPVHLRALSEECKCVIVPANVIASAPASQTVADLTPQLRARIGGGKS
jgi:hypothetical protein